MRARMGADVMNNIYYYYFLLFTKELLRKFGIELKHLDLL